MLNIHQIDRLLNHNKKHKRKANSEDLLLIKNELFYVLSRNRQDELSEQIRKFLGDMHYLKIYVENEDDDTITFYYEPHKKYYKKINLNESGWIQIEK